MGNDEINPLHIPDYYHACKILRVIKTIKFINIS
jgi:hypothetical protein